MKSALEKAAQLLAIIAAAVSGCAPPLLTTSPVPTPTFITQPASLTRDESVHTNQIGYQPDQFKQVVVSGELPIEATFNLVDEQGQVEFTGPLVAFGLDSDSRDQIARGDFSAFDTPGTYRASVDGHGASYPFVVAPDANA
ncbi:MAG: cellulase N-terminal Ig-like domain-containing protein, partial [Chloroflexota bacterium]